MLSKLRFSLTMNTRCLMGVVVGNCVASTRDGRETGGFDDVQAPARSARPATNAAPDRLPERDEGAPRGDDLARVLQLVAGELCGEPRPPFLRRRDRAFPARGRERQRL